MNHDDFGPCPFCGSIDFALSYDGGVLPDYISNIEEKDIISATPYVMTATIRCLDCGCQMQSYAATDNGLDVERLYMFASNSLRDKWNHRNKKINNLRKCPICGASAKVLNWMNKAYVVECSKNNNKHCVYVVADTREEAIKKWNGGA